MEGGLKLRLPIRPRALPGPGEVDCWLLDLSGLALPATSGVTQTGQPPQALRLHRQFLLRLILGAYLGLPGKDIVLVRSPAGKPGLAPALAASGLHFNLSHSGSWLAVAVGQGGMLGVDIERERRFGRALDLARRYFSRAEAEHLAGLEEPARSRAFLKLWTVREACIKAVGTSLARSLQELVLAPDGGALLGLPADWPEPRHWSIRHWLPASSLQVCIAAPRPDIRVRPILLDCSPS